MQSITIQDLHAETLAPTGVIVDARSAGEYSQGHVPGAINLPHDQAAARAEAAVPHGQPVFVYCAKGGRAQRAAMVLAELGHEVRFVTGGGMPDWARMGFPVAQ